MFCETEAETYADPARELIFQVARGYLERVGITATELVFSPAQHRTLLNDGPRFQEVLQRIALLQGQHTKRPVAERMRELTAMAEAAMQRVDTLANGLPESISLPQAIQAGLFNGNRLDEWVVGGIVLARLLTSQPDWSAQAALCLDLLEAGAGTEAHAMADQTLSEIFRLKPVATALFGDANRRQMIELCLSLAGGTAEINMTDVLRRLRSGLAGGSLERCQMAVRERLAEMLGGTLPLYSAEPYEEFSGLLTLKERIVALPMVATDDGVMGALTRRFTRFAAPDLLNPLIGRDPEFSRKLLTLLRLYREIEEGNARFELQGIITHYMEHREFTTKFIGPQSGKDDFANLSAAISAALVQADIPEPRKTRLLDQYRNQLGNVVKPSGSRIAQRGVGTSKDAVVFRALRMPLKNWSPVALLFGPCPASVIEKVAVGDKMRIGVEVRASMLSIDFTADAEVLRVSDGLIAARYSCSDAAITQRIQNYFTA